MSSDYMKKMFMLTKEGLTLGTAVVEMAGSKSVPMGAVAIALEMINDQYATHGGDHWQRSQKMAKDLYAKMKKAGITPEGEVTSRGVAYED